MKLSILTSSANFIDLTGLIEAGCNADHTNNKFTSRCVCIHRRARMCIHSLPSHSQYSDSSKKSDVMIVVCSKQALHSAAGAPRTRMIEKKQQIFDPMVLKWVEWLLSRTESICQEKQKTSSPLPACERRRCAPDVQKPTVAMCSDLHRCDDNLGASSVLV